MTRATALETCRRSGLRVTASLDELRKAGSFDLVRLNHGFEHLSNPIETLTQLRGLLAREGRFHLEVPNPASLRSRLSSPWCSRHLGFDERFRAFPIRLSHFSPAALRRCLERNGFRVEWMTTRASGWRR